MLPILWDSTSTALANAIKSLRRQYPRHYIYQMYCECNHDFTVNQTLDKTHWSTGFIQRRIFSVISMETAHKYILTTSSVTCWWRVSQVKPWPYCWWKVFLQFYLLIVQFKATIREVGLVPLSIFIWKDYSYKTLQPITLSNTLTQMFRSRKFSLWWGLQWLTRTWNRVPRLCP